MREVARTAIKTLARPAQVTPEGESGSGGAAGTGGTGGMGGSVVNPQHEQFCKLTSMGRGASGGYAIPGVAGAPKWGMPSAPPAMRRVRRSWSSLNDAEKKKVVDAFIALKSITVASGDPGSARANYTSFCDELGLTSYDRNLYDFYVEAHMNAYVSMMTPTQSMAQMTHMNGPPDTVAVNGIFDRPAYDSAPYDSCHTEEGMSFRQYLEGFTNDSTQVLCVAAGCEMHGRGHVFIGGDMQASTASPNDPVFFLNHAEVDRLWAAWQEYNLASGDPARTVDHGNPDFPDSYRGPLFNFEAINASDTFDYKALGYEYDALPSKN